MPRVSTLPAFRHAVTNFDVVDLAVDVEPAALHAARGSIATSGLLLVGEVHGVAQNPMVIRWLIRLLDLRWLALEWPTEVADVARAFVADGVVHDHEWLGWGDGRVTAGHLAVLGRLAGERAAFDFLGFDAMPWTPLGPGESEWTARDRRMAETVLARPLSGGCLVVAGNAHTGVAMTSNGVPMGSWSARSRPGLRTITIRYCRGGFYNLAGRRFPAWRRSRPTRLHLTGQALVLDLPHPTEAIVMQG